MQNLGSIALYPTPLPLLSDSFVALAGEGLMRDGSRGAGEGRVGEGRGACSVSTRNWHGEGGLRAWLDCRLYP